MMRRCFGLLAASDVPTIHQNPELTGKTKKPHMRKEIGVWNHTPESLQGFIKYCKDHHARAHNNVKICTTEQFSRCLRSKKEIGPGDGIATMPANCGYNFLRCAKQMQETPNTFPMQITWMNWNEKFRHFKTMTPAEMVTAGWMVRDESLEESDMHRFFQWICRDTRGHDGASSAITQMKQDGCDPVHHFDNDLSLMVADACLEPGEFMNNFFIALAAQMSRSVVLEPAALECYLEGTTFFKSKLDELFAPTIFPFFDCVPHDDAAMFHNTMCDYFTPDQCENRKQIAQDLELSEDQLDFEAYQKGGGLVTLRAIRPLDEGDVLLIRGFPKGVSKRDELADAQAMEGHRMANNTYVD